MEDSGYYSHKSGEFKLFSPASTGSNSQNSYRRRLFSQELLGLDYEQFQNSDKFRHLVNGFRDENDFEEFKADLRDFWKLKEETCEEFIDQESNSPGHMLMEFFNSDENFQEFERVFDDFKHHRFYDFDLFKRMRSKGDPRLSYTEGDSPYDRQGNQAFSEFFDNDEDFKEFEEEFANFKVMQRRSRALDDFNRRSWCDLRSDINSNCDNKNEGRADDLRHQHRSGEDLGPYKGTPANGGIRQDPRGSSGDYSQRCNDGPIRRDHGGSSEGYSQNPCDTRTDPRGSIGDYSQYPGEGPTRRDSRGPGGDYSQYPGEGPTRRDSRGPGGDYSHHSSDVRRESGGSAGGYSQNRSSDFTGSGHPVCPEYRYDSNGSLRSQRTTAGLSQSNSGNDFSSRQSHDSGHSYGSDKQKDSSDSYSKYERSESVRKPGASFKSHSCDLSESSAESEFRKSSMASRSQSYDFSQNQEEDSYNKHSKASTGTHNIYNNSDRSEKSFSEKDLQTRKNAEYKKHSYERSNNAEHAEENLQSNKTTFRSVSCDLSDTSEQESRDFDKKKSSSNLRSSRSYDLSEESEENSSLNHRSCATTRSRSHDFSENSEKELRDRISRNSASQRSERSEQDFSNRKSYDLSEQSQQNFSSQDLKSRSTSRSQTYDFSEKAAKELRDRTSSCTSQRNETSEQELSDRRSSRSNIVREHSTEEASERCSNSSAASRQSHEVNTENSNRARNENLRRSYDFTGICDSSKKSDNSRNWGSGPELRITESSDDLFSDIYHGSTDFSKKCYNRDFLNYMCPSARSQNLADLPRKPGKVCDISDSDIGGTYPRLDRLPRAEISDALKRRSAEYSQRSYSTDVAENLLASRAAENRVSRDYSQRRSNSDQSMYSSSDVEYRYTPHWSSSQDIGRRNRHDFSPTRLRGDFRPASNDYGEHSRTKGLSSNDCQYTCHHRCRPLVTLDCTTVSAGDKEAKRDEDDSSAETSLSESAPLFTTCYCDDRTKTEMVTPSSEGSQNDDTDSGYRSGTLQDGQISESNSLLDLDEDSLKKEHLRKMIEIYNEASPSGLFSFIGDSKTFQGFIGCTLNLIRPITMSLGARPPSIYEVLTKEHIIEQNTMSISFYMPRDTVKHIHVASDVTAKEVIAALLKKFKILDNPRKFAMYSQELKGDKIVKIKRVGDKEFPLQICLSWGCEDLKINRLVLQENETGEIEWNAFSLPELQNFMRILDREQDECIAQLQYKYKVMKRIIQQRLKEFRKERKDQAKRS